VVSFKLWQRYTSYSSHGWTPELISSLWRRENPPTTTRNQLVTCHPLPRGVAGPLEYLA